MSILKTTIIKTLTTILAIVLMFNTAELESKPKKSQATRIYNDNNISMYAQRVILKDVVKLKSVKLKLYSNRNDTKCRLRLFGSEGGNTFPMYQRNLIKPIEIKIDSMGVRDVIVSINEDIVINYGQYFICLDSISKGLNWVSNEKEFKPTCQSESGTYYKQILCMKEGNWLNGKYSFIYKSEYDTVKYDKSTYFTRVDVPDIIVNDSLKNGCVNIFDYNDDKQFDILVDNKLYRNLGNLKFQENTSFNSFKKTSELTIAFDVNNDGTNEVIYIGEKDTVNNTIENSIYRCSNNDNTYQYSFAIDSLEGANDFIVDDLNNDGYKDIILIQSDTVKVKYIFLKNNRGKIEQDYIVLYKHLKEYEKIKSLHVIDINYDKQKDVVFIDNSNAIHYLINWGDFNFVNQKYNELNIETSNKSINAILAIDYDNSQRKEFLLLEDIQNIHNPEELPEIAYLINKRENTKSGLFEQSNFDEKMTRASISDINNDGKKDILLFTDDFCHRSFLLMNKESNKYKNMGYNSGYYANYFPNGVLMTDMNSDGKTDIATYEDGKIVIYKNSYDNCEPSNKFLKVNDKTNQITEITVKSKGQSFTYTQDVQHSNKMLYSGEIIVGIGNSEIDTVLIDFNNGYSNQYINLETNELAVERIDVENNISKFDIELKPNPFKDNLELSINMNFSSEIKIKVSGLSGVERYSETISGKVGNNIFKWDCRDNTNNSLENGMYIIEVTANDEKYINKIIKID